MDRNKTCPRAIESIIRDNTMDVCNLDIGKYIDFASVSIPERAVLRS